MAREKTNKGRKLKGVIEEGRTEKKRGRGR